MSKIIVGLGEKPREYVFNGVRYIVSFRFQKADKNNLANNFTNRMERCIKSDFTHLMNKNTNDIMQSEYVCSAANRKEAQ